MLFQKIEFVIYCICRKAGATKIRRPGAATTTKGAAPEHWLQVLNFADFWWLLTVLLKFKVFWGIKKALFQLRPKERGFPAPQHWT